VDLDHRVHPTREHDRASRNNLAGTQSCRLRVIGGRYDSDVTHPTLSCGGVPFRSEPPVDGRTHDGTQALPLQAPHLFAVQAG
jgi:hypothetical protein